MSGGSRRHRTPLVHGTKKNLPGVRSEINVTPLVDVCLVLLIIFMVITPMLQRGRDVPLPKTRHHEEKKDLGEQPIVSVATMQGKPAVFLGKERVPGNSTDEVMEELTHRASDELERKRAKGVTTVFVKADASIKYGDIYPVLIALQKAKSDGVELGVFELKEEK